MRLGLACLALSAFVIAGFWVWLGAAVPMPQSPLGPGEKLYCLSYAPFRGRQTPLDANTHISAAQIDDDLARFAKVTDCVRTYSTEYGQDQVAAIAARHGLKVLQGLWLSGMPNKNRVQVETAMALANRYPDDISAVIVGNEVLLRGELSPDDLAHFIREVKAAVPVPVTYADVWEFWLRNRDLARRSTSSPSTSCHIGRTSRSRPRAAAHVDLIRRRVAASFPGKEILIGEFGWPSAGRMREGALPSPSNQAKVIQDVLALAQARQFPRQRHRGLRPAVEACARRHGRRPLGPARRCHAARRNSSAARRFPITRLAMAGGRRNSVRADRIRCRLRGAARHGDGRALAGGRRSTRLPAAG